MMVKNSEYVESCGNVYKDLNIKNPEIMQIKSLISIGIQQYLDRKKLSLAQASKIIGVNPSCLSRIFHGNFSNFSVARLIGYCDNLGLDVDIKVKVRERK